MIKLKEKEVKEMNTRFRLMVNRGGWGLDGKGHGVTCRLLTRS